MNGRNTPEDRQRSPTVKHSPSTSSASDVPDSPVMGAPSYVPAIWPRVPALAVLPRPASPSLFPSWPRPSNVTWNMLPSPNGTPQKSHARNGSSMSGHSRSGSTTSINEQQGADALDRSKSTSRSLRSPALPDSPWVDNGHTGSSFASATTEMESQARPPTAMSGMELGSPIQASNRILRSPTPTHSGSRSPTSPTFQDFGAMNGDCASQSRRSSKQTHHTSSHTFSLGTSNALLFSPIANSSRSSLESAGSSYHTWDEDHTKDRLVGLFSSLDPDYSPWHDISLADKSGSGPSTAGTSPYDSVEPEDAVKREIGLTKNDFVAIQDKLVSAALSKAATPENRARAGSIRRRRPSTSQSNYSYNGDNRNVNATPQPQAQPAVIPSRPATSDHVAKANALLNAVVHSIESPNNRPTEAPAVEDASLTVPVPATSEAETSPMRRNRALADALFGSEDQERATSPPVPAEAPQISFIPDLSEPEPNEDEPIQAVFPTTKPLQTRSALTLCVMRLLPNGLRRRLPPTRCPRRLFPRFPRRPA
ncbi:hypothetical protein NUW54_g12818 [Trametes sanguinea]|uniref:Uncharacterized protein n=1 Tax=Trametes sanguinea TaxID=158606 RepID=A0ACC1MUW7_9APHY|nr:hypothetical protein NUW54_g12818 [Trametes sanguinea]